MKKFISLILAVCMMMSICAVNSFALAESEKDNEIFTENGIKYELQEDNRYKVVGYEGKADSLVIPNMVNGKRVTAIGLKAFFGKDTIKYLEMKVGIIDIEPHAFSSCVGLLNVVMPEGLKSVGAYAFNNCRRLKFVTVPTTLVSIDKYAFNQCIELKNVVYNGTTEDYKNISIGVGNTCFEKSNIIRKGDGPTVNPIEEEKDPISLLGDASEQDVEASDYKVVKLKFNLKSGKKSIKITLKKIKGVSKISYRYKLADGKKWSKSFVKKNKTQTYTIKNLKKSKKYLISVRCKVGGEWTQWCKAQKIKTK